MVDQFMILDHNEKLQCVLSNTLEKTCRNIALHQVHESFSDGTYSDIIDLTVPATHPDAAYVVMGAYVIFQDLDGFWQEYEIVRPVKVVGSGTESVIAAYGEHAFYELEGEPVDDKRPTNTTALAAGISMLEGTRWQIGTVDDLGNNSIRVYKTSSLAGLAAIASTWGGELRFRIQVVAGVIVGRYLDILARRGNITGMRFELNKNMTFVKVTPDKTNLCTALIGRGKGVEVDGGSDESDPAYGRRLEFGDVSWSVAAGDPADKPLGKNYIEDPTASAAYGPGGRRITKYVNFDDITDPLVLLQATYDELQNRKVPQVTYEMKAIDLERLSGYSHMAVRFGDTVSVIDNKSTPPMFVEARVIMIDRNLVDPRDCMVELGNYMPDMQDTVAAVQMRQSTMLDRAGVWDRAGAIDVNTTSGGLLAYTLDLLKTQLIATNSGYHTDANGNQIWEDAAHTSALMIGGGGLAIANSKTGGEYNYTTILTGSGMVAEAILAGTIASSVIFAGTLSATIGTFVDLIAGIAGGQRIHVGRDGAGDPFLRLYDNSNNVTVNLYKKGVGIGTANIESYTLGTKTGVGIFVA